MKLLKNCIANKGNVTFDKNEAQPAVGITANFSGALSLFFKARTQKELTDRQGIC